MNTGDRVRLNPDVAHHLFDGAQMYKEHYQNLYANNVIGTAVDVKEIRENYLYGVFAKVLWDDNTTTDTIEIGWLQNV